MCVANYRQSSQLTPRLSQPVGVGFSYGSRINDSRTAAYGVYDFLQKFFILFLHLARYNQSPQLCITQSS
jgi:hypothetical protein